MVDKQTLEPLNPGILESSSPKMLSLRILILDNEPELLEIYRKALSGSEQNFRVTCCRRAKKALEKVEAAVRSGQHFAVVFLDINLKQRFDGITVGEKIRQLDPHTNPEALSPAGNLSTCVGSGGQVAVGNASEECQQGAET